MKDENLEKSIAAVGTRAELRLLRAASVLDIVAELQRRCRAMILVMEYELTKEQASGIEALGWGDVDIFRRGVDADLLPRLLHRGDKSIPVPADEA